MCLDTRPPKAPAKANLVSTSVLPSGLQKSHNERQAQQKTRPTGYETEILIQWISMKIDELSVFHGPLYMCHV